MVFFAQRDEVVFVVFVEVVYVTLCIGFLLLSNVVNIFYIFIT
jgi:hypothetical protein